MPYSVSSPGAVPFDHGLLLDDPFGMYGASCMCKPRMLHSMKVLRNPIMSSMKQPPVGNFRLEKTWGNFDHFSSFSDKADVCMPPEAIVMMFAFRVQDPFHGHKRRKRPWERIP